MDTTIAIHCHCYSQPLLLTVTAIRFATFSPEHLVLNAYSRTLILEHLFSNTYSRTLILEHLVLIAGAVSTRVIFASAVSANTVFAGACWLCLFVLLFAA